MVFQVILFFHQISKCEISLTVHWVASMFDKYGDTLKILLLLTTCSSAAASGQKQGTKGQ